MGRPLVLMIDRDTRAANIRANVLEISGYAVRVADGPERAVQTLEAERPNLAARPTACSGPGGFSFSRSTS
jgi:DNA-binding response OmpR family regulator